jgi:hypothetical protein
MITKIFEIITKTGKAEKDLENVGNAADSAADGVEKVNDGLKKTNKEAKNTSKLGKAFGVAKKGAKGLTTGFKAMGTALKAAGIGLIIAAFTTMKSILEENQTAVDFFAAAMETAGLVFRQVADALKDVYNNVSKSSENFDALGKVLSGILTVAITPIKLGFQAIKAAIVGAQLAWEQSWLGNNDPKRIAELKAELTEIKDAVVEIGTEAIQAGTDIVENFSEAIEEAGEIGNQVIEKVGKINVKTIFETAKANVELKKSAELAAVANQGLIEKYDRQAEQQRQIRDDERKSITERKKANDELLVLLNKQETAMLANAKTVLKAAQAELKKDKNNIEFKKAEMEALNELAAVRATVAGFKSEQLVNEAALEKEAQELINARLESEASLSIEQKRFNAEQIKNDLERLEKQKEIDAEERKLQTTRLQGIVNTANAGTQAKIDAQIALNEFNQQSDQQEVTRLAEIEAEKLRIKTEADAEKLRKTKEADAETKRLGQKRIDDAQIVADAEKAIQDAQFTNIESGLNLVKDLAGDNNKIQAAALIAENAVGVAKTIINTQAANAAALATPQAVLTSGAAAIPVIAANNIAAGISIAASVAATAKGLSALKAGGSPTTATTPPSGGTSASGGASPSQAPSFSVVGQSGFNQVAGALGSQQPVQAFVVAGDVTNAQQLQNNTITQATF